MGQWKHEGNMLPKIDRVDSLLIRACKHFSFDTSYARLEKLHKKFYATACKNRNAIISSILMDLCDKFSPIPASKVVTRLHPEKRIYRDYMQDVLHMVVTHLAQTSNQELEKYGYISKTRPRRPT